MSIPLYKKNYLPINIIYIASLISVGSIPIRNKRVIGMLLKDVQPINMDLISFSQIDFVRNLLGVLTSIQLNKTTKMSLKSQKYSCLSGL